MEGDIVKENLRKEYISFLSADDTQAFIFVFIGFSFLLIFGYLDMDNYRILMSIATGAFFGEKLTDIKKAG